MEAQLNDRQKRIVLQVLKEGAVTSGWCTRQFEVVYDTANRDLKGLIELQVLQRQGRGRAVRYVLKERKP